MKKIKNILLALIFVPCAIFFSACGGVNAQLKKEASVDTEGTYITSSKSELSTYIGCSDQNIPNNEKTTLSGYRITCKTVIDNNEMKNNAIFILGNTISETQFAGRTTSTSNGKQIAQANMYLKDGWVYVNAEGGGISLKQKYLMTLNSDITNIEDLIESFQSPINFIEKIIEEENINVYVSIKGATKKFKIEANTNPSLLGNELVSYLIYENDILQGIKFTTVENDGLTMDYTIERFSGSIKFPSFKGYIETTSEIEDWINPFE